MALCNGLMIEDDHIVSSRHDWQHDPTEAVPVRQGHQAFPNTSWTGVQRYRWCAAAPDLAECMRRLLIDWSVSVIPPSYLFTSANFPSDEEP
jgi:hypothetical protein